MNLSKNTIIKSIALLAISSISPCNAAFGFLGDLFNKKPEIANPHIDKDLIDKHLKLDHYENILGYKKDEYVLLYGNDKVWLFDMDGNKYKEWNTNVKRAQLLKNCNLMVIDDNLSNKIFEKKSSGEVVWSHKIPGKTHHDFEITPDGHITFFYRKLMPKEFELKNNCKHDEIITDVIVEVDREGKEYFKWEFYKYFGEEINKDYCYEGRLEARKNSNYSQEVDTIHPNALDVLQDNKWYRKGYKEFRPGNILVTAHHLKKIFIIDKETKEIVWVYDGSQDNLKLDGSHEAKMIAEGLPGAGNILIFDNGLHQRKYTLLREINPVSKETVWNYSNPRKFYSKYAGSHQRLKNGDTFISDDGTARAFIIDKQGKIKWQFIHPGMENPWVKRARLYPIKDFGHCLKGGVIK